MRGLSCGVIVLAVAGLSAGAAAQDPATERGRQIARTWCVECHAIGPGDQPGALAAAPPFRSLAAREGFGPATLRRALLLPHPVMPEFPVTTADIEALAAYIGSLAQDGPAAHGEEEERTDLAPAADVMPVAGTEDRASRGRAIVARDCAPCHLVEGLGESPNAAAPAFATLSQRYPVAHLAEALAEGIMVGHEGAAMPEFAYEPQDVDAIIAHLERVQAQ